MPFFASEDFSYYLLERPGAFFFLGSGKVDNDTMLHNPRFNFNDNLIESASKFWLKVVEDRLGVDLNWIIMLYYLIYYYNILLESHI